jgi:uncharacterized membrane protein (DUF485 family)
VESPAPPAPRVDPALYTEVEASEEFRELRRSYRRFAFPVTVAFLSWYLLYVLLSSYADGFMSAKVVGHLNVAFVFGVAQFATTFLIAWLYARYAGSRLDPAAERLKARVENGGAATAGIPSPATAEPDEPAAPAESGEPAESAEPESDESAESAASAQPEETV